MEERTQTIKHVSQINFAEDIDFILIFYYVISSFLAHFTNTFWAENQKIQHVNQTNRSLIILM